MKQSSRFERFLLSSVDDIPRVQLRYRELNDTQQALFSSPIRFYVIDNSAHLMTSKDLIRMFWPHAECRTFSAQNSQLQGKKTNRPRATL